MLSKHQWELLEENKFRDFQSDKRGSFLMRKNISSFLKMHDISSLIIRVQY